MWPATTDGALIGMGCMRLSTRPDREDEASLQAVHAGLDAGVCLLDTADAYCWDATETGHNERLIARALSSWNGDRGKVVVSTKGGLTRPDGRWVPDGRARALKAACERSLTALDVSRIDLYQLHVVDPNVGLATSVRALAALERDGLIAAVGLCNVTVGQIEEARRLVEIASVQVELSLWSDTNILNGVADYCLTNGIRLLAYRPLGGADRRRRVERDPLLISLAEQHGATPAEIALAWLSDFSPHVTPIPGPTKTETARSTGRARAITLSDTDRQRLDERFPAGAILRRGAARPVARRQLDTSREVVLIMGLPGAGKSTLAASSLLRDIERLNRDMSGGSLKELLPELDRLLASGASRVVLDNTYVTRASRAAALETARKHEVPVRCVSLDTQVDDAQVNAVMRMLARYGRLLPPEEMRSASKNDVTAFGPGVQFRYQRDLEPPDVVEGFAAIERRPFERQRDPSHVNRALIVWCDGVLWGSRSGRRSPATPADVEIVAGRREVLARYQEDGWRLLGLSWQPEVAEGNMTGADVQANLAHLRTSLGVALEVEYCPHAAGPPVCWCRKPLPGLGALFIHRHQLDPASCIYVGNGSQDPGFARKLGFQYRQANEFFR